MAGDRPGAVLQVEHRAIHPEEPGLDIIVIHGFRIFNVQNLQRGWSSALLAKAPKNTRIFAFDAGLAVEDALIWKHIEEKSTALGTAIHQEYTKTLRPQERPLIFIGYSLAGIILKQTLFTFSQRADTKSFLHDVCGIIFIATRHIWDVSEESVLPLTNLRKNEHFVGSKIRSMQTAVQSLRTYSRRFEEMKLTCSILSCFETVPLRVGIFGRRVQLVDKNLVKTSATNEDFESIDCKLSMVLDSTECAVHKRLIAFFNDIWNKRLVEQENPQRSDGPRSVVSSTSTSSQTFEKKVATSSTPVAFGPPASPERSLSPKSSHCQETPLAHSASSDEGFIVIWKEAEIKVPQKVAYVQTPFYEKCNPDFVGREDILCKMEEALIPSSERGKKQMPRTFVLCGPAGIGKTQIASTYLHAHRDNYDVVLWVQANSKETLSTAFNEIATILGIHIKDRPGDMRQQVVDWLRNPIQDSTKRHSKRLTWLLVFDSADQRNILLDFWPQNAPGSIIITTQDRNMLIQGEYGKNGRNLEALPKFDAIQLLKRRLPPPLWVSETEDTLEQVVDLVKCWPIGITQIYYEETEGFQHGYTAPISSLWTFSDSNSEAARTLLSILSLLVPESIPENILTQDPTQAQLPGFPVRDLDYDIAISDLMSSSTIDRATSAQKGYSEIRIHSFIQEVVRNRLLRHEDLFADTFNATIRLVMTVWPSETQPMQYYADPALRESRPHRDRILTHLTHLHRMFGLLPASSKPKCAREAFLNLLSEVGWYYFQRSEYDKALEFAQQTLDVHEICPEKYPRIVAGQYGTRAQVALSLNQPETALQSALKALQIRQHMYAETKVVFSQLVASYATLGKAKIMSGALEEAEELVNESLHLRKQTPRFSKLQLYTPLMCLALIAFLRSEYEEAAAKLMEALEDREEEYGKDDTKSERTGHLLLALGTVFDKLENSELANEYHQRACNQLRQVAGDDAIDTADAWCALASHYMKNDTLLLAQSAIDKAQKIYARSRYHQAQHARALFLRSRISQRVGDSRSVDNDLKEIARLRRTLVPLDPRQPEDLEQGDFDQLLAPGFR